jgi:glycerol-3-phosphate acyltransferase PlsY
VPILGYILTALGAYLLGSIPFGFLVAKAKGIDIRSVGSGNIGATNACVCSANRREFSCC